MYNFLVEFGKGLFKLGVFSTTNGLEPVEQQCFGAGLYLFCFGAVSLLLLIIIGIYLLFTLTKRNSLKIVCFLFERKLDNFCISL